MTTYTIPSMFRSEIIGAEVQPGHVVQVRDEISPGESALMTVFVLVVHDIDGIRWLDGKAVLADEEAVMRDVFVTVHTLEPVGVVGWMPTHDWSADYARRAARA